MAVSAQQSLAVAFNNDQELQQFMLAGVTPTGRVLGTGSYGSVEEVAFNSKTCAAKKLHENLLEVKSDEDVKKVVKKYKKETKLMSHLNGHVNIVRFYGLCFITGSPLPRIVMERLETSLDAKLSEQTLSLFRRCSILENVACGLLHLHERTSPVIHRDLTARNVLLNSSLVAKITDMGNSRIIEPTILSKAPGTKDYMPPEALEQRLHYGPSLDVFSFGHLALYVLTQKFPVNLPSGIYYDPENVNQTLARNEVERRKVFIDLLELQIGSLDDIGRGLVELVKQCLHNAPQNRPSTSDLHAKMMRGVVHLERIQQNEQKKTSLTCSSGPDMPFYMGHYVQSVAVGEVVYVGGGDAESDKMIMEYDMASEKWADTNIEYKTSYFSMTAIKGKLVLVGGYNGSKRSKEIGVWDAEEKRWTHPYPDMQTARGRCSVVVYKDWLVAAGGWPEVKVGRPLESVEVMNIVEKRWYSRPSMPIQCVSTRAVIVHDTCYFMGGLITVEGTALPADKAYAVPIASLIHNHTEAEEKWLEIPVNLKYQSPLSFNGSLLAVGGVDKDDNNSNLICIYNPELKEWRTIGKLLTPRRKCTCQVLQDGRILVAGGNDKSQDMLKEAEIVSTNL